MISLEGLPRICPTVFSPSPMTSKLAKEDELMAPATRKSV